MPVSTKAPPKLTHTFADRHFVGRLSEELSDIIAAQSAVLMEREGISIPPKSCSLMVAIEHAEQASAKTLAESLERSHQLISQKLPKLMQLGLIERIANPNDGREKLYQLSAEGVRQMQMFHTLQPRLEQCYAELFAEVGDVSALLGRTIAALRAESLAHRIDR